LAQDQGRPLRQVGAPPRERQPRRPGRSAAATSAAPAQVLAPKVAIPEQPPAYQATALAVGAAHQPSDQTPDVEAQVAVRQVNGSSKQSKVASADVPKPAD